MKRLLMLLMALGVAASPAPAVVFHLSPDVPTDDPALVAPPFLPWDVVRVDGPAGSYTLTLSLPVGTPINALHQTCTGDWLLAVETPTDLGGTPYEPRDVVRYDPGLPGYSLFFCGGLVGVPPSADVDAAYLEYGDDGPLIVSFDVPTDLTAIGGGLYEPADLVRFARTGPGCAGWSPAGLAFDGSATAPPVPASGNVTGAHESGGLTVVTFDVPTTLGGSTFLPGELLSWDGAAFNSLYLDPAWTISSRVDALSFLPGPGRVPSVPPNKIHLSKPPGHPPAIRITWSPSSSAGAEDYGIYEGSIGSWYSHTKKVCTDTGGDLLEDIVPQAADSYYLVVPLNASAEGSYGFNSAGAERPVGSQTCRPVQSLTCP